MAVHGSIRCSSCVCARGWNWSTGRVGVTGNASLFLRSIDAGRSFGAHRFPLRLEAHTRYGTVRYGTVRYRPAGSLLCVSATLSLRPGIPCSEEVRGGLFLPRATPRRAAPALMDPPPGHARPALSAWRCTWTQPWGCPTRWRRCDWRSTASTFSTPLRPLCCRPWRSRMRWAWWQKGISNVPPLVLHVIRGFLW